MADSGTGGGAVPWIPAEVSQMTTRGSRSDRDEEAMFEKSLGAHGQLAGEGTETVPAGATHQVETTDDGERKVVRKRFSAI